MNPKLLILEDESSLRTALFRTFDRRGCQVVTANRIEEAKLVTQGSQNFDLAIIDINLPDGDGIQFMEDFKKISPTAEVIILTGQGGVETAVRATQKGAFHFFTKPFNLEELISVADRALSHKKLSQENQQLRKELNRTYRFDQIIGQSDSIQEVLGLIKKIADSDATVLVMGESGTGKELIARAIHYNSDRAQQPFVAINCGAIPSELLESELFGHVKGAFTGAIANRVGRFELADGGTIFLDEIGDLEPALQVKLLRALQERSFEPVGSTKTVTVSVRVIAATNIDLEGAVEQGRFREDLYYRLNVIPMSVPPLRERKADIPLLLNHFLQIYSKNKGRILQGFGDTALACLMEYSWPGNIRELENLVERMSILKVGGMVDAIDLPRKYQTMPVGAPAPEPLDMPEDGIDFNSAVDAYENALILRALERTGWNRNQAATILRLNRTTLVEKIKKKGLKPKDQEELI